MDTTFTATGTPAGSAPPRATCVRGSYDEIRQLDARSAGEIITLFKPCLPEAYFARLSKRHTQSLNFDLYGYDPEQNVAVIQVRQHAFDSKYGFGQTHKTYLLCGFNEITNAPFRHPVSAHSVHAAIHKGGCPVAVVRAAQRWMWQCTERQLATAVRQGDVLLVKERGVPVAPILSVRNAVLGGSHEVRATDVVVSFETIFAIGVNDQGERAIRRLDRSSSSWKVVTSWNDYIPLSVSSASRDGFSIAVGDPGADLARVVELRIQGRLFANTPTVLHNKGQHAQIWSDREGWHSVRIAREAAAWNFAERLGD